MVGAWNPDGKGYRRIPSKELAQRAKRIAQLTMALPLLAAAAALYALHVYRFVL